MRRGPTKTSSSTLALAPALALAPVRRGMRVRVSERLRSSASRGLPENRRLRRPCRGGGQPPASRAQLCRRSAPTSGSIDCSQHRRRCWRVQSNGQGASLSNRPSLRHRMRGDPGYLRKARTRIPGPHCFRARDAPRDHLHACGPDPFLRGQGQGHGHGQGIDTQQPLSERRVTA